MTSTQTIFYTPGPNDPAIVCVHDFGPPGLGVSAPCDVTVWIKFSPRHLPALREYVAALDAYDIREQAKYAAKTEVF